MIVRKIIAAILCALLSACQSATQSPIAIKNAWSPATPPSASAAAVYMQITARAPDVLLSATTPVADRAEMHTSMEDGGMMRMRPLATIEIAADDSVRFEPGGHHFMLMGLHAPLAEGSAFPMTLAFRNAGEVTVEVSVKAPVHDSH